MDADRFDRLTRILADGLPRRRLFRVGAGGAIGLFVGTTTGRRARAANDPSQFCKQLPPGLRGKCRSDAANGDEHGLFTQCEGDPNRLCQAPDGSFACCNTDEGCCDGTCVDLTTNANCGNCGTACSDGSFCVDGGCCQESIGGACGPTGGCCTGLCRNGFCGYAGPGEPCEADADCSSARCDEERGRCSLLSSAGGPCETNLDCTEGECNGETCQVACLTVGEVCTHGDDCCRDEPTNCLADGICDNYDVYTCRHLTGGTCNKACDCYSVEQDDCQGGRCCHRLQVLCDPFDDLCCHEGGSICSFGANSATQQGEARCCRQQGGVCTGRLDCCDNYGCQGGVCCGGAGAVQCSSDDECCDGVVCRGTVCCFPEGTTCTYDEECCAGAACRSGVCTSVCVPEGGIWAPSFPPNCCQGLTATAEGVCCTSGKACFDRTIDGFTCCVNPDAACTLVGDAACCESGTLCGVEENEVCCDAGQTCMDPSNSTCG